MLYTFVKTVTVAFLALLAIAGSLIAWMLHPWMPSGTAVALGKWQFGDTEFQVWQRKNPDLVEAFADGLFVRHAGSGWKAFLVDHQDTYSPTIRLERSGSEVFIYRGGERRGAYSLSAQTFRRHEQSCAADLFQGYPPGDWWLRSAP